MTPKRKLPDNLVLIGKKKPVEYVGAILTQLVNGEKEIILKSRGFKECLTTLITVMKLHNNTKDIVPKLNLWWEPLELDEGKTVDVPFLEVFLRR